jgi:integrase
MAHLTGLFRRGGSFYIRIVLPKDHPLQVLHSNGRLVKTLGPCSYKAAIIKGTIKRAEVLGNYDHVATPHQKAQLTPNSSGAKAVFLRDVYDRWIVGVPRSADTIACCGRALKLYEAQTENTPIEALTRAQGELFRTWLQSLPATSKTSHGRLIWVKALLRYATEDLEWINRNPWERLDIPFKTTNKRRPWTDEELCIFFSQDIYTQYKLPKVKKAGADAAYWIPLLGIYTGARVGELAQLRLIDVLTDFDIPCLSINAEGEGRKVKTEAGVRLVPIHSELIKLGFLEYVSSLIAKKESLLWPLLPTRENKSGGHFSNWFGTARRSLGFGKAPDFHCFRHTVRTSLVEAEVNETVIDALLGHEAKGSTGAKVYTHTSTAQLKKAVERISYSLKLECASIKCKQA